MVLPKTLGNLWHLQSQYEQEYKMDEKIVEKTAEVAQSVDEVTARINRHIAEEVEKRVSAWLQVTHGVDFVEQLRKTSATNTVLKSHNAKFFALLKECYTLLKESFDNQPAQPEAEWPILYKLRTTIGGVRELNSKAAVGRIIKP